MSPAARWQRIQQLCDLAERVPPDQRAGVLAHEEPDAALRDEALRMLEALDEEPRASGATTPDPLPTLPARIGPYTVTGVLGHGGTGVVYAAGQQIAVKALHAHLSDAAAIERFRREQVMLARLEHPAIARVLDAGTAGEQPWIAMERIDGQPIDAYCRAHGLHPVARVRLMLSVCDAVDAAHRAFVVHLDLKPSNVLVTAGGHVKLLDFGTAKLIDPDGALTTTRQLTPLYASPEQLRGDPVTTACDVYSLGLMLFELLTGAWPFTGRESFVSIAERASGEASPRTLSSVQPALRGDLDIVVSKALAPHASDRYATVGTLADDLRRYLDNRPVLARRQTAAYRMRKYAARNRGVVSLTAVLFIGLCIVGLLAWREQRERLTAGRKAQATAGFLLWMMQSSNPMYGGRRDMSLMDLVEKADKRLEAGAVDPVLTSSLQATLASLAYANGRPADGERMALASLERAQRSGDATALVGAANVAAQMDLSAGRCAEAVSHARAGDAALARGGVPAVDRIGFLVLRAQVKENCEKDATGAVALMDHAARDLPRIPDDTLETATPPRLFKALFHVGYSMFLSKLKRFDDARRSVNEGLRLAQMEPESGGVQVALLRSLAAIEYNAGNLPAAAAALGRAVEASKGVTSDFEALRLRVMWASRLAESGDRARAVQVVNDTLAQTEAKAKEIGPQLWMIYVDAAFAKMRANDCADVPGLTRKADEVSGGKMPPQWTGNRLAAEGLCLVELGRRREAGPVIDRAYAALDPYLNPNSPLRKRLTAARDTP